MKTGWGRFLHHIDFNFNILAPFPLVISVLPWDGKQGQQAVKCIGGDISARNSEPKYVSSHYLPCDPRYFLYFWVKIVSFCLSSIQYREAMLWQCWSWCCGTAFPPTLPLLQWLEVELSNVPEMCPLSHGVSQNSPGFHATHSKCLNALPSLSIQLIKVYNSCYEQLLNLSAQIMLCSAGVPHSEFIKTWLSYHLFPSQELWELWHRRKTEKQNWHWFPCVRDLAPRTSNIATRVGFFFLLFFLICIALLKFFKTTV